MSFDFPIPTTSPVSFAASYSSVCAPSLPATATTHRSVLRDFLKRYKRLSPVEQSNAVPNLLTVVSEYLPYLYTLDSYIVSQDITHKAELETEWRAVLSRRTGPAEAPRIKRKGIDYELCFATATLAYAHTLKARLQLKAALSTPPDSSSATTSENLINQSAQSLITAASIFLYLQNRSTARTQNAQSQPADVSTSMYTALVSMCLSSATLLAVLRQDPYPSIIALQHDPNSREWMYKAPTVPTGTKALLLARFCMYSADLAAKAAAGVGATPSASSDLKDYCDDLARTARAKACRFFGIDAESKGEMGKAIGWVVAGKEILGLVVESERERSSVSRGLDRFKKAREERKIEKSAPTGLLGSDAGRLEEAMVLNELERKWKKVNDSVCLSNPTKRHNHLVEASC